MRILIGSSPSKINHFREFEKALTGLGVECKLICDQDVCDGFPNSKISKWFQSDKKFKQLIIEFSPDVIIVDRLRHFALVAARCGIPLAIHLRGDIWTEFEYARQTIYKSFIGRIALCKSRLMAKKSFKRSSLIMCVSEYLENIVHEKEPDKKTTILHPWIDTTRWYQDKGMNLKHPCVGLLQNANIWGKAKEVLVLENVLKLMPDVMFYYAGDGEYTDKILPRLEEYPNFEWLGPLEHPDEVRQYLTEIDVYALFSGLDMAAKTLQEAQLMKKPVVATNVGGIPEHVKNNVTGFLVDEGSLEGYIGSLSLLVSDEEMRKRMGESGREFIEENFDVNKIAKEFLEELRDHLYERYY